MEGSKYNTSKSEVTIFESVDTFSDSPNRDNVFHAIARFVSGDVEGEVGRVGALRYLARNRFAFKIVGKILIGIYPHSKRRFEEVIDTEAGTHLDQVLSYTIKRSAYKPIKGVNRRTERFYKTLSLPPRDLSKESLLVIGGKDVAELLMAWCYGFRWKNISGIDLFSLHPKIEIMDMESMSFEDASFENVTLCHTYGYQADKSRCIFEISRILKNGGHFVFNSQFASNPNDISPGINCNTSPNEMRSILENAGLSLIYSDSEANGPYTNTIWLCRKRG